MVSLVKQLVDQSDRIVVLSGLAIEREAGLYGTRQEERVYDIEARFRYSPEEIATRTFWSTRSDLFYKFVKEYVVDREKMKPTAAHWAIRNLEKRGKLSAVITKSIYGIHQMAEIQSVIELYGSVHQFICPKCRRMYNLDYIMGVQGAAHCQQCGVVLKPGFTLFREKVDNGRFSVAADTIAHADMLVAIGAKPSSGLVQYMIQYYQGNRLVFINQEHFDNERANYVLFGSPADILPKIF